MDLQVEEEEITKKLKEEASDVTHVFYTAYIHDKKWDPNNLYNKNVPMFTKFIKAIDAAANGLQRIELQTGGKYYGIHKGATGVIDDNTPRYKEKPGEPDFYFGQEDFLTSFQQGKKWKYTIYRPNVITGVTRGNGMSIAPTLAVYFTIQKYLGKKALFPGNEASYKGVLDQTYAGRIAEFAVWSSTQTAAENEDFLLIDSNTQHMTGEQIWRAIAEYFGVEVEETTFPKTGSQPKGNGNMLAEYSLADYMKDKKDLWKEIAQKYNIDEKTFEYTTPEFVDQVLSFSWPQHFRMIKAEKIGWKNQSATINGYIDSFNKMKEWKMIPKDDRK